MVRIPIGVAEIDEYLAGEEPPPPIATSIADVSTGQAVARIGKKTRGLVLLEARPSLRRLIAGGIDDRTLAYVGRATGLEHLSVLGSRITNLRPLATLHRLRLFDVNVSSRLRTLDGIEGLSSLEYLAMSNCSGALDVAAVARLRRMKVIFLSGFMHTPMRIDSLAPLSDLTDLRVLQLQAVRVRDRSLAPLHGLIKLHRLDLPRFFPAREIDALADALPSAQGNWRRWVTRKG